MDPARPLLIRLAELVKPVRVVAAVRGDASAAAPKLGAEARALEIWPRAELADAVGKGAELAVVAIAPGGELAQHCLPVCIGTVAGCGGGQR